MKSIQLTYPYEASLKVLRAILLKQDKLEITAIEEDKGVIKANIKRKYFQKARRLDLKVQPNGSNAIVIKLMVNSNALEWEYPSKALELAEEKVAKIIYSHF